MEWALYITDELRGLIVAVVLVMPDKKLTSVTVESVLKKFLPNHSSLVLIESRLNSVKKSSE